MSNVTQTEAIIEAFKSLGGTRRIVEIKNWVDERYGPNRWKDFSTRMADIVPLHLGGNGTSNCSEDKKVLKRIQPGYYSLSNETCEK